MSRSPIAARRIYVCCPGDTVTGGPELLHQLVAVLSRLGLEAFITYFPVSRHWRTPSEYLRYECPIAHDVADTDESAIIVPEVYTSVLKKIRAAQRVIWWLSVDNYRGNFDNLGNVKVWLKRLVMRDIDRSRPCIHLFQSQYARDFVWRWLGADGWPLSDYLADEYFTTCPQLNGRSDTILFNPKKGYWFTRQLIRHCSDLSFVPLINMTRAQVKSSLERSKIYVDFGPHPGKDRLPREAAMCGCVVVVGQRGSARNASDVPLAQSYKFPVRPSTLPVVADALRAITHDYATHLAAQAQYRLGVLKGRDVFDQELRAVFSMA